MCCDVSEVTERFKNEHENEAWRISCDVGKATEGLKNEL